MGWRTLKNIPRTIEEMLHNDETKRIRQNLIVPVLHHTYLTKTDNEYLQVPSKIQELTVLASVEFVRTTVGAYGLCDPSLLEDDELR